MNKKTKGGGPRAVSPDITSLGTTVFEPKYKEGFIPGLDLEAEIVDEPPVEIQTNELSFGSIMAKKICALEKKREKEDEEKLKLLQKAEQKPEPPPTQQQSEDSDGKIRRSSRIKSLEERGPRNRRREVVFSSMDSGSVCSSRSQSNLAPDEDSNSSSCSNSNLGSFSPGREDVTLFPNNNNNNNASSGLLYSISSSSSFQNTLTNSTTSITPTTNGTLGVSKPLKVKSRWSYSLDSESLKHLDLNADSNVSVNVNHEQIKCESATNSSSSATHLVTNMKASSSPPLGPNMVKKPGYLIYNSTDDELKDKLKKFEGIDESIFLTERKISRESKKMVCDCYLSREDIQRGEIGCNDDCLNRLLMVECSYRCPTGERCTNKKFQNKEYCKLEVFRTEKKGHGLRTRTPLPSGGFVIEYVGEVLDPRGFLQRTKEYAKEKQEHFYFMALKSDAIIDATRKGNCSRFINHSCEPNCETQKWTVNGELRIGFFSLRDLAAGEEITFDYQFQRYGKKAQKCYCQAEQCRGWIGGEEDENATVKLEPWQFVEGAKRLFEDWTALKEAFRIPKTERSEAKEQEREADTGVNNTSSKESSNDRDRDSRYKHHHRLKGERKVQVLDSSSYNGHFHRSIRSYTGQYNNMTKEQRRLLFAARVAQEEKEQKLRQMQDQMVALHQNRCANLNLDPATTPIVDPSGIYYLDPKTISWKEINPQDPDIPPELLLLVHASQHPYLPPPTQEVFIPEPAEVAFPPWPVGLPPPPPLPPTVLPSGWRMAVDDEGRCYYYHVKTGFCQWDPPSSETSEAFNSDTSETDDSDADDDGAEVKAENDNAQAVVTAMEKKSRTLARRKKRKLSGLVQERILSDPEDDVGEAKTEYDHAQAIAAAMEKKARSLARRKKRAKLLDLVQERIPSDADDEGVEVKTENENVPVDTDTVPMDNENAPADTDTAPVDNEDVPADIDNTQMDNDNVQAIITSMEKKSRSRWKKRRLPGLGHERSDKTSKIVKKLSVAEKLDKKQSATKSLKEKKASEEYFRNNIANVIVQYLNPYRKPDCKNGHITSTEDFKHLARKLTHIVTTKEVKHCKNAKTLVVNDSVKHKTKEFVRKYMAKFAGRDYLPSPQELP